MPSAKPWKQQAERTDESSHRLVQTVRSALLANPLDGAQHGQRQDVALRMAAAETRCAMRGRPPSSVIASASLPTTERHQGAAGRQTELARGLAVARRPRAPPQRRPARGAARARQSRGADERQHRVQVVEAAEARRRCAAPTRRRARCQRAPASPPRKLDAPEQRRGVDQVGESAERARRGCARRTTPGRASSCAARQMEQRQCHQQCVATTLSTAQAAACSCIQRMPASARSVISKTCAIT